MIKVNLLSETGRNSHISRLVHDDLEMCPNHHQVIFALVAVPLSSYVLKVNYFVGKRQRPFSHVVLPYYAQRRIC